MNLKTKRFGKVLIGAALCMTIGWSVDNTIFASSHSAYAASASVADNVIATGKQFLGVPYRFGAKSNNTSAFDCSSFTQYVYGLNGIHLPRSSRQQSNSGVFVPRDQLQPGDLIFSDTNRDGVINHVSIYIGNGQLLHTYRVGIGVTISKFSGSAWDRTYVTARRVLPSNGQAIAAAPPVTATAPSSAPVRSHPKPRSDAHSVQQQDQEGEH